MIMTKENRCLHVCLGTFFLEKRKAQLNKGRIDTTPFDYAVYRYHRSYDGTTTKSAGRTMLGLSLYNMFTFMSNMDFNLEQKIFLIYAVKYLY